MKVKKIMFSLLFVVMIFLSVSKPLVTEARELPGFTVSCAVPLPPSAPGEEKKDMITAVIGLTVLGIIVVGGLSYLKKNFGENE